MFSEIKTEQNTSIGQRNIKYKFPKTMHESFKTVSHRGNKKCTENVNVWASTELWMKWQNASMQ